MARLALSQTARMCRRLGSSLRAGLDVVRLLQRESEYGSSRYRREMAAVAQRVMAGSNLAEAMKASNGYFPPLLCELVDVGEQTGRLEAVLLRLAEHYEHVMKLRRIFLLGILWPALELTAAIGIVGILILVLGLIPGETTVFGLAGVSGLIIYLSWVAIIFAALGGLGYSIYRGWLGRWPHRVLLAIPGVGRAIRTMALARFSWTLSMALNAGLDAGRSLWLALQSSQNSYYTRHAHVAVEVIGRGGQFHEALRSTGVFPDDFLSALSNAELSGTESESLERMSEEYQQRAESAFTTLTVLASSIIFGMVIVILVVLLLYLIMSLIAPYYQEAYDLLENP